MHTGPRPSPSPPLSLSLPLSLHLCFPSSCLPRSLVLHKTISREHTPPCLHTYFFSAHGRINARYGGTPEHTPAHIQLRPANSAARWSQGGIRGACGVREDPAPLLMSWPTAPGSYSSQPCHMGPCLSLWATRGSLRRKYTVSTSSLCQPWLALRVW